MDEDRKNQLITISGVARLVIIAAMVLSMVFQSDPAFTFFYLLFSGSLGAELYLRWEDWGWPMRVLYAGMVMVCIVFGVFY